MVMIGYNTPSVNAEKREEGPEKRLFHNRLSAQAGAYQNSTWSRVSPRPALRMATP